MLPCLFTLITLIGCSSGPGSGATDDESSGGDASWAYLSPSVLSKGASESGNFQLVDFAVDEAHRDPITQDPHEVSLPDFNNFQLTIFGQFDVTKCYEVNIHRSGPGDGCGSANSSGWDQALVTATSLLVDISPTAQADFKAAADWEIEVTEREAGCTGAPATQIHPILLRIAGCNTECRTDEDCDDGNPCTDDRCDSELGCQYVNNTKPCDDGDACTVEDVCADGECAGTEKQCDDGLYCTGEESCDPHSGECVSSGDPCPWGTVCNEETHECEEYECGCFDPISVTVDCTSTNGAPVEFPEFHYTPLCLFVCEDTEGKTIACPPSCEISCHVGTNAVSSGDVFPIGTTKVECEIGFATGETATAGIGLSRTCEFFVTVTCLPPPPPPPPPPPACTHDDQCDDGIDCTIDRCVSGHCEFTPDDALCDDGDLCTMDQCDPVNGCLHEPVACPEDQVCDPASGQCVECLNDDDCEDGSFCNGAETCVDGVCQDGTPPCPEEFCDEVNDVCAEVPAPAPLTECQDDGDCDDGVFCNGAETCVDGVCQNGTPPCSEDLCDEENDLCAEPSGDGTLGSGQGAGPQGTRGACGLFNGVALLVLPLGMLLWMGLRSHSRRRI